MEVFIGEVIDRFIYANIAVCCLFIIVLILKMVLGHKVSSHAYYFLWGMILLRGVMLIDIPSPISLQAYIENVSGGDRSVEELDNFKSLDDLMEVSDENHISKLGNNKEVIVEENYGTDSNVVESSGNNVDNIVSGQQANVKAEIDNTNKSVKKHQFANMIYSKINAIKEGLKTSIINHPIILFIYFFISFIFLLIPLTSMLVLKKDYSLENNEEENSEVMVLLFNLRQRFHISKKVAIQYAEDVTRPGVLGVIKPIIILPEAYKTMERDKLQLVLSHELMHIEYNHIFFLWLGWLFKALNWMNPVMWFSHKEMKEAAELSCDQEVLKCYEDKTATVYGHLLIDIAANKVEPVYQMNVIGFGNNNRELEERIRKITKGKAKTIVTNIIIVVALILILAFFGTRDLNIFNNNSYNFNSDIQGVSIEVEDFCVVTPTSMAYENKTISIGLDIEYLDAIKDYYKIMSIMPEDVEMVMSEGLSLENTSSFHCGITFPGSRYEEVRRRTFYGRVYYHEEEGEYEAQFYLENSKIPFTLENYGPCYLSVDSGSIHRKIEGEMDQSIEMKNEKEWYRLEVEGIGVFYYGNLTVDGTQYTFDTKFESEDLEITVGYQLDRDRDTYGLLSTSSTANENDKGVISFTHTLERNEEVKDTEMLSLKLELIISDIHFISYEN